MTQQLSTKAILESLLFAAPEPVTISRLASVLEIASEEVELALTELQAECSGRGVRLQRDKDQVQFVTMPEAAPYVERLLGLDLSARLSAAALEALGIIAYRQPVTRAQIEAIRGVSCDGVLRTLLGHGLIEEGGRLEQAGRPILYQTTFQFLQHFGLTSLGDLPQLPGT
jgi:segregation and condensation protein B